MPNKKTNLVVIGQADGKPVGFDLSRLIYSRLLIQANSGAGKSYLLRKLIEELFGRVQVIVVDLEGEFATLREKFDFVLVAEGGETPAHPSTAEQLAITLLELRASAICDLYELPAKERHTWVRKFLESMMNAPKKLWHPVIVVVDEAHVFCPEKGAGESEAADAMIDLATRGRKRGFCAVWATQRLAKLRNDAAAELQNVLIGGTFLDVDVERAAKTLGIAKGKETREFAAHMKVLTPGTFVALGRAISKERIELQVGKVQTTHPQPGSAKHAAAPPPPPEKIRALLPKLAELPQVAQEKAKTMAQLQQQLRTVTAELSAEKRKKPTVEADPKDLQRKVDAAIQQVVSPILQQIKEREGAAQGVLRLLVRNSQMLGDFQGAFNTLMKEASQKLQAVPASISLKDVRKEVLAKVTEVAKTPAPGTPAAPVIPIRREATSPREHTNGDDLRDGAVRILTVCTRFYPDWLPKERVASLAALKQGGTFSTYQSALNTAGFIRIGKNGRTQLLQATESGRDYIAARGDLAQAPTTTEEVIRLWEPRLRDGAQRMLHVLVELQGEPISRQELAERAGVKQGGTFSTYLSSLNSAGLIVDALGGIAANKETLFL